MSRVFKFQSTPPFVRTVDLADPWAYPCADCHQHISEPWVSLCEWCIEAQDQAKR